MNPPVARAPAALAAASAPVQPMPPENGPLPSGPLPTVAAATGAASVAGSPGELQAQALVRTIEQQVAAQRQALLASALAQAADIRQRAQVKARTRLRRALQQMRAIESQAVQQLQAEIETAARRQASVRARQALDRAWPALERAVAQRWQHADGRARWFESLLAQGRARLPPTGWTVRHPAAWSSAEAAALQGALLRHGAADARLQPDTTLAAGLVIEVAGARLDGTPRALLADRPLVEATLLAAFESAASFAEVQA